jgi:hypothetical protein
VFLGWIVASMSTGDHIGSETAASSSEGPQAGCPVVETPVIGDIGGQRHAG